MPIAEGGSEWSAVEAALERYFLARERGEAIDVKAACGGDVELAAKVLEVLGDAPDMVVEAAADPAPEQPTSFGDFDVVEQIGRGGMGTVYLALQRSLGREVALKVLDSGPKVMPSARVRMRREAELTALLDHPNIVPVYAVGEVGEVPFIAMKYLVGPTLAEVDGPWPAERVARVGKALAEALDAAHLQGVVHRDVKPANVIMDGETPVFVDFGLARAQSDPTLTQEGKVAGTLRYMAPERLDSRSVALDPRVDVYGLGATLYELLAGHEVFADDSPTALVRSVLVRDPAKLRLRGRDHDLATIVMRALAKEPGRRFPTARDMADDLGRYLNGEPVRSRRVSWIERGWRQVRRYPRVSASLAAALLVVAVSLSFYFVQQRSSASDRERRLTAARADLGGHRYAAARDELERLAQRFPGDAEIGAVFAEAEAQLAVDRLLVLAADHADNIELADVRSLVDAGASAHGERSALLQLGAVVALGHRGDRALARERLAALVGREDLAREFAAIDAWLEQRPLPWQLPDAREDRSPDLAMLTAMVRRLAGDQPRQLLAELLRCAPAEARTPRHVFMEAVVLTDLGRFDVAAGLLRGLASEHAWPAMWRWLAHAQIELGRLERASFSLRMAAADRSRALEYLVLRHRLTAAGVYDYLEVARRFASELEAEQDRSPAEEQFLAEVSAMVDPGAVPAAVARLAALERGATNRLERDRLVALQVQLSGWHLPGGFGDEPAREQHAQFVDRWLAPAARLGNPVSRAIAGLWIARSLVRTGRDGDLARGLERFHEVAKARPDDARAAMEFAIAVIGLPAAGGDEVQRDAVMRGHMHAARMALQAVLVRAEAGQQLISDELLDAVRYYAFLLTWKLQDCVAMVATFPEVEHLLPAAVLGAAERDVNTSAAMLRSFRRR